jgi:dihydrofolate synthase/folylpolyglutamate synthase
MTYEETLDWLFAQLPMFQRTGPVRYRIDLAKTLALCEALGHPERGLEVVHIAGTNGKGSVSHAVAAALQARGDKVGLYTSPHLEDPRERIRVNGEMIPKAEFVAFVSDHQAVWADFEPSFFELMFCMALDHFRRCEVDLVVLETGMGGRLDSTNIFHQPWVTAITSIGLDHQQFLGNDLRSIAGEKAGILKEGVPCVLGVLPAEARSVVLEQSMRLGVEVYDGLPDEEKIPGPAWLQRNRAVARRMLQLIPGDSSTDEAALMAGPVGWGLQGRWHWWSSDLLLDCAHNVEGLTATGKALEELGRPIHLVFAAVADKDIPAALACLPAVQDYYWCAADVPRAMPVEQLAEEAKQFGRSGTSYGSVAEALYAAREAAQLQGALTVVLGSVFTVGEALTALNQPVD